MTKEQEVEKRLREAYKYVFSTPEGKQVLENICYAAGVFECRLGDFEAGQRNTALRILNIIEYKPEF